ncbi:acetolactate synthase large subunit [Paenirhodobacter sp.]|uniref:acetolactate synthase large subunit n=1 Tax=Paenirhodobacter sp. TaxID=1965326 RepID=UPI003B508179
MNGAEALVTTLLQSEVEVCFANPGTSEMHFVAALDRVAGMKCVLGLHETVVTGMADAYFRMAGKPAATLLHCGPGLANGMANLHNARRGRSGIVNIVGDQATWHRPFDAPLTADTEGMARTVSHRVETVAAPARIGGAAVAAIQAARQGQIATLILPADVSWQEGAAPEVAGPVAPAAAPDAQVIETAARLLRDPARRVLLFVGGNAAMGPGQRALARILPATGAEVMAELLTARMERGQGRLPIPRIPYPMDLAMEKLAPFDTVILVGAKAPVAFFGYPGRPSSLLPEGVELHVLARPEQDAGQALAALADALAAPEGMLPGGGPLPEAATGAITPESMAQSLGALLPEGAIVVDESITFGRNFGQVTMAPHDWLALTGGAIGDGLPMATGAALATGRRVVSLQADGSAAYSLQALWTQARENLPCTTLLISNRRYNILIGEYHATGATPGPTAMEMLDLGRPDIDWVSLARGFGVEAARAETMEQVNALMRASFARTGPFLIELVV